MEVRYSRNIYGINIEGNFKFNKEIICITVTIKLNIITPDNYKYTHIFIEKYNTGFMEKCYNIYKKNNSNLVSLEEYTLYNPIYHFNKLFNIQLKWIITKFLPLNIDVVERKILEIIESADKYKFLNMCNTVLELYKNEQYFIPVTLTVGNGIKNYFISNNEYIYLIDNEYLYRISPDFLKISSIRISQIEKNMIINNDYIYRTYIKFNNYKHKLENIYETDDRQTVVISLDNHSIFINICEFK